MEHAVSDHSRWEAVSADARTFEAVVHILCNQPVVDVLRINVSVEDFLVCVAK